MAVRVQIKQWNADKLLARATQILEDFGPLVAFQSEQEIAKEQYTWPVTTRRKNGQVVTSPRDIVDTGRLINSATPPEVSSAGGRIALRIAWTAPYAYEVLKGGYLVGTTRQNYVAPERDWISRTYRQLQVDGERPFLPFLVRRWNQLAGRT
jgi:hypothetical protein